MTADSRKLPWLVWGGLALVAGVIVLAYVRERVAAGRTGPLPVIGAIPAFQLTNQLGAPVSLEQLRGQVWVADIIFTRCAGPCAKMTRQLAELQNALPAGAPVRFVSLTTDPDFDTPGVLKKYGARFGASDARWSFLTGPKPELGRLAREGLKLAAIEKQAGERDNEADLFIHSTVFVVVDRQARLRAVVETQPRDFGEDGNKSPENTPEAVWKHAKARLLAIVAQLSREP
ncbi:MAG: SCO family protein [Verrucomicrobia bacterium]|nr:SCO family protein [Verrucomicrobiota bacterium]